MWHRLMAKLGISKTRTLSNGPVQFDDSFADMSVDASQHPREDEFANRLLEDVQGLLKQPDGETSEGHRISMGHLSYVMPAIEDIDYNLVFDLVVERSPKFRIDHYHVDPVMWTPDDRSVFRKIPSFDDMVS